MKKIIIGILIFTFLASSICLAKRKHPERYYQDLWCAAHEGQTEHRLPDGTRVDCLTETHAIEFDFADKWAEAIGQSLYYSCRTDKRAGVVLIFEGTGDEKYRKRLDSTVKAFDLPVDVWITEDSSE